VARVRDNKAVPWNEEFGFVCRLTGQVCELSNLELVVCGVGKESIRESHQISVRGMSQKSRSIKRELRSNVLDGLLVAKLAKLGAIIQRLLHDSIVVAADGKQWKRNQEE